MTASFSKLPVLQNRVILLTGLSGSGKSTIAIALDKLLKSYNLPSIILDADDIRKNLWPELKYSSSEREQNLRRFTFLAKRLSGLGVNVIMPLIAPYEVVRTKMRKEIGHKFIEVFVATPLYICEERDVRGLYKKARTGEIKEFTGITAPFERPQNPDITCFTQETTPEQEAQRILDYLVEHEKINPDEWQRAEKEERKQEVQGFGGDIDWYDPPFSPGIDCWDGPNYPGPRPCNKSESNN